MDVIHAEIQVLKYKLDRIRSHIERRLSVVDESCIVELDYILKMISTFEQVPAGWELSRPLVNRKEGNNE